MAEHIGYTNAEYLKDLLLAGSTSADELEAIFNGYHGLVEAKPGVLFNMARRIITVSLASGEGLEATEKRLDRRFYSGNVLLFVIDIP